MFWVSLSSEIEYQNPLRLIDCWMFKPLCLSLLIATSLLGGKIPAAQEFTGDQLVVDEFLVLPRVGRYGRVPLHVDPLQAELASGDWRPPTLGSEVSTYDGKKVTWQEFQAGEEGWLEHTTLWGGYAYAQVKSAKRQVALLEASGHAMVFVNGEPRAGDPYLTGSTVLPIMLNPGTNELLFHAAAGKLRVKLSRPTEDVIFDLRDVTKPDLVHDETEPVWLGVVVVNCREQTLRDAQVKTTVAGGGDLTAKVDTVPPLSVRKVAIPVLPNWKADSATSDKTNVEFAWSDSTNGKPAKIELSIVEASEQQTRTFRSKLDGSVQAYRLLPAKGSNDEAGMLVSLHDADETPTNLLSKLQAAAGVHLLAPTGRRVEGCDWEDWSARDVLEALDDAAKHVKYDPRRTWLRGTNTGGHGVLRLGGIAADRWAALAPRDPWLEYGGDEQTDVDTPVEEMLERVAWSNRLTPLLRNTVSSALLLEEDKSNPLTQELIKLFRAFHPKFESRTLDNETPEQNLTEVLKFVTKHLSPTDSEVEEADCVTFSPGVNSQSRWLTILGQEEQWALSRAAVKFDRARNLFLGLTVNVKALSIETSQLKSDTVVEVALDGEPVGEFAVDGRPLTFLRHDEAWQLVPSLPASFKRPARYGGLRSVFENNAVLVYGTNGTPAESQWALAKARYDAETMLVRLNGSAEIVADKVFKPENYRDRNVVLYGNADTNLAWPVLLSTSPAQMRRDGVWIDRRPELGDDLACVFVHPRRGSSKAVVGVIGGTGINGMRTTDRLPVFVNGTNFPDLLLYSSQSLMTGNDDVRAAGFFGIAWTVEPGEIVWRDAAL